MTTDVRVMRSQRAAALVALVGYPLSIDEHPPASGPEIEITVEQPAERVEAALEQWGVSVLAIREREHVTATSYFACTCHLDTPLGCLATHRRPGLLRRLLRRG